MCWSPWGLVCEWRSSPSTAAAGSGWRTCRNSSPGIPLKVHGAWWSTPANHTPHKNLTPTSYVPKIRPHKPCTPKEHTYMLIWYTSYTCTLVKHKSQACTYPHAQPPPPPNTHTCHMIHTTNKSNTGQSLQTCTHTHTHTYHKHKSQSVSWRLETTQPHRVISGPNTSNTNKTHTYTSIHAYM